MYLPHVALGDVYGFASPGCCIAPVRLVPDARQVSELIEVAALLRTHDEAGAPAGKLGTAAAIRKVARKRPGTASAPGPSGSGAGHGPGSAPKRHKAATAGTTAKPSASDAVIAAAIAAKRRGEESSDDETEKAYDAAVAAERTAAKERAVAAAGAAAPSVPLSKTSRKALKAYCEVKGPPRFYTVVRDTVSEPLDE